MNYKTKKLLAQLFKIGIVISALSFLYLEVFQHVNFNDFQMRVRAAFVEPSLDRLFAFFMALFLMPLNWIIETFKWKYLLSKIEQISFFTALKGVLSGITFTAITPNRTGEFLGRVIYVKNADKIQASLLTLLGGFAQLSITLVLGSIGTIVFLFYYNFIELDYFIKVLLFILLVGIIIFTPILFLNTPLLSVILKRIKFLSNYLKYINTFSLFETRELLYVLLLSFLRYMVFTSQFILLLYFFQVDISFFSSVIAVMIVFFIVTIIPSAALYEIGIRESVAIYFIGFFSGQEILIMCATLGLWLINVAFPGVLGSFFVLTSKIISRK